MISKHSKHSVFELLNIILGFAIYEGINEQVVVQISTYQGINKQVVVQIFAIYCPADTEWVADQGFFRVK